MFSRVVLFHIFATYKAKTEIHTNKKNISDLKRVQNISNDDPKSIANRKITNAG